MKEIKEKLLKIDQIGETLNNQQINFSQNYPFHRGSLTDSENHFQFSNRPTSSNVYPHRGDQLTNQIWVRLI